LNALEAALATSFAVSNIMLFAVLFAIMFLTLFYIFLSQRWSANVKVRITSKQYIPKCIGHYTLIYKKF